MGTQTTIDGHEPEPEPAFTRSERPIYDFDDYASHCYGHMVTDFATAMGSQEASFSSQYLNKFTREWRFFDQHGTGWLQFSAIPALCRRLTSPPNAIQSWVLQPSEEEAMAAAPPHLYICLRDFCLFAEKDELYIRGEGDEDLARLQPGYMPPTNASGWAVGRRVASSSSNSGADGGSGGSPAAAVLNWPVFTYTHGEVTEDDAGAAAAERAYRDTCLSHLRIDLYSCADHMMWEGVLGKDQFLEYVEQLEASLVAAWLDADNPDHACNGNRRGWISRAALYPLLAQLAAAGLGFDAAATASTTAAAAAGVVTSSDRPPPQQQSLRQQSSEHAALLRSDALLAAHEYRWRVWNSSSALETAQLATLFSTTPEAFIARVSLRSLCLLLAQPPHLANTSAAAAPLREYLTHCVLTVAVLSLIVRTYGIGAPFCQTLLACLMLAARRPHQQEGEQGEQDNDGGGGGGVCALLPAELWHAEIFPQLRPRVLTPSQSVAAATTN